MSDGIKENDSEKNDNAADELYEIINPSDPYTFRASSDKVALAVCLLAGRGKTPGTRLSDGEDIGGLLMFMSEKDSEQFFKDTFDGDFGKWVEANHVELIKALESVLCMSAGDRFTYETALELMPDEESRQKYRDKVHDRRRSSMNDIGGRCWRYAENLRKGKEEKNVKDNSGDK